MKHQYSIEGMTCNSCVANVTSALKKVPGVKSVQIDLPSKSATIEMYRHIPESELQATLGKGKYTIRQSENLAHFTNTPQSTPIENASDEKTDFQRLYPLFLIFAYLTGTVLFIEIGAGSWNGLSVMQNFMGGFFLIFSFFKFLDLQGFASSFSMYDPLAQMWGGYGYVYPFIELGLGIGFLLGFDLVLMSLITFFILGVGTIGVARTVMNKRKIQCACLGTVFNLPMTKVTLIENSIMLVMAGSMITIL